MDSILPRKLYSQGGAETRNKTVSEACVCESTRHNQPSPIVFVSSHPFFAPQRILFTLIYFNGILRRSCLFLLLNLVVSRIYITLLPWLP